jgi:ribosomal protein S21
VITVEKSRGESQEALIRRFLKKVKKSEILKEVWDRKYYEKPSTKKNVANRKRKRLMEKLRKEREQEDN